MGFLTKIELKKQLQQLGIKVEGNYIHKGYITKIADQIRAEKGIKTDGTKNMVVILGAGINPDFAESEQEKITPHKVPVKSLEHASEVVTKFIEDNNIGSGQWYAVDAGWVYQKSKKIARIHYNGRIDNEVKAATDAYLLKIEGKYIRKYIRKSHIKKFADQIRADHSLDTYYHKMKEWALESQKNWEKHMAQIAKKPEKTDNFSEPDLAPLFLKATGIHPNDAAKITDKKQQKEILDKHFTFLKRQNIHADAHFTTSTGQYDVYVMSDDEGKEAGRTVPTEYALKRSKRTNKKIKLNITGYRDTAKNIANALKLAKLIDRSATGKDIEYDGDENEIGVWYKDVYKFTLIRDNTSNKVHSMDNLDKLEFEAKQVNTKLNNIANELKKAGIEITEIQEGDMDTDALIGLTNNYYLQIGYGYICLNMSSGTGDDYGVQEIDQAKTVKEIIPKIKKHIP